MRVTPLVLGLIAAAAASGARAGDRAPPDGLYEVEHRLDLPHLESGETSIARVCLRDVGGTTAFPVLSANTPLAACPASGIRREGAEILFEIACPGGGAARARAVFDVAGERFQGSIAMTMGGKNMTMTEVQRGRRVGPCDAPAR